MPSSAQNSPPEYLLAPLRRLAEDVGETTYLSTADGLDVVVVASVEGNHAVRVRGLHVGLSRLAARARLGQADPRLRGRRAYRGLPRGRARLRARRARSSTPDALRTRARGHPRARPRVRRRGVHRGRLGRLRAGAAGRRAGRRVHDHHPDRALQRAPGRTHRGRRGRGSRRLQAGALDVSLIYIEFISRRPGVALEAFHAVAGGGQEGWAGDYDDDVAVLNLGRTWRMGPEPEYLTAWYSPSAGLERLDEWERIFKSGDAARFEEPFRLAARIDRSGVYEPLIEPVVGSAGRYYAEFFDVAPRGHARRRARPLRGARGAASRARAQPAVRPHRPSRARPARARVLGRALVRGAGRDRARARRRRAARSGSSPRRSTTTSAPRRCERMTPPLAADGRGVIVASTIRSTPGRAAGSRTARRCCARSWARAPMP